MYGNMQFRTENKKKFPWIAFGVVFIFLIISIMLYYLFSTKSGRWSYVQEKGDVMVTERENVQFSEYENRKYGYTVRYPNNWYISSDEAESDLVTPDEESGIEYLIGGQAFWSNYANIDDYGPQDKPDDFRLLGLTIYQGNDELMADFIKKIGVSENATRVSFETKNQLLGTQFIFTGLSENDLKVTVIFEKNKLFYVFKTAFINGDEKAAEIMEDIVRSFMFKI